MRENHEGPQLFGAGLPSVSLVKAFIGDRDESTTHRVTEHSSAAGPKGGGMVGCANRLLWNSAFDLKQ